MKKYLLLVVLFSFVLFGCAPHVLNEGKVSKITEIDINAIVDLSVLQGVITQVSLAMNSGVLSMEQAEKLTDQLQQKYLDLINTSNKNIEATFATIEQSFNKQSFPLRTLPLWAKKIGLIEPQGMLLDTVASKYLSTTGYDSTILVYTGDYALALQQAERIAKNAHLQVSESFKEAQSIAQGTSVDYISGLDVAGLRKGIIYVNHELLDTAIDTLLSVSVDQEGTLTIEATKYEQTNGNVQDILSSTDSYNNLRKQGERCGENIGNCEPGLKCSYPCGIQGCEYVCQPEDELPKP